MNENKNSDITVAHDTMDAMLNESMREKWRQKKLGCVKVTDESENKTISYISIDTFFCSCLFFLSVHGLLSGLLFQSSIARSHGGTLYVHCLDVPSARTTAIFRFKKKILCIMICSRPKT